MNKEAKLDYVFKIIFFFITERKKLDLIAYNKNLQNLLDINLINYKIMSRKYKIGKKNGIGKEYNYKNQLIYEGEYKNGKRNGKGKEYEYEYEYDKNSDCSDYYEFKYSEKTTFEGEFLNGKRNGEAKVYNDDGNLIFEGEYFNGNVLFGKKI